MYADTTASDRPRADQPTSIDAALKHRILSRAEERPLILAAQRGSRRATERLVLHHLRLAASQAHKFSYGTYDDRFQAGVIGIYVAIERYKPESNARLANCAYFYVRNEIRALDCQESQLVEPDWVEDTSSPAPEFTASLNPLYVLQSVVNGFLADLLQRFNHYLQAQLSKLPANLHELAKLRWLGTPFSAIAKHFAAPITTIKSRYSTMVKRFLTPQPDPNRFWRRFPQFKQRLKSILHPSLPPNPPTEAPTSLSLGTLMKPETFAKAGALAAVSALLAFGTTVPALVIAWGAVGLYHLWQTRPRLAQMLLVVAMVLLIGFNPTPVYAQFFLGTEQWAKGAFPGTDGGFTLIFNGYRFILIGATLGFLGVYGPKVYRNEIDGSIFWIPAYIWIGLLVIDIFLGAITGAVTGTAGSGGAPPPGTGVGTGAIAN